MKPSMTTETAAVPDKSTPWKPVSLLGYESRFNAQGYRETRPIQSVPPLPERTIAATPETRPRQHPRGMGGGMSKVRTLAAILQEAPIKALCEECSGNGKVLAMCSECSGTGYEIATPEGVGQLPPLDVTDEERKRAESLTEEDWLANYAMASPIELLAIRYCRERQLLAALAQLAAGQRSGEGMGGWISVDTLPELDLEWPAGKYAEVMVYANGRRISGSYSKFNSQSVGSWASSDGEPLHCVTHWQHLPAPPSESLPGGQE